MRRSFTVTCVLFLFICASAQNKVYTVDNIPKVRLTDKTQYVSDPAGILGQGARNEINGTLYKLEQETTVETVVIVVPSIGDTDCFDFSHRLLNEWGVGKKGKDNGLVILLVTDQRCIQFYTGYGLEGDLPDAICKRIQTQHMLPYLKDGNWNDGMVAGVQAVYNRLIGMETDDTAKKQSNGNDANIALILLLGMGLPLLIVVTTTLIQRRHNRCPKCGKNKWQRTNSAIISNINGIRTEEITYLCRNCGHLKTVRKKSYDQNYRGPGGPRPFIGGPRGLGGGRGFGGGGSFGGGSFGGGRGGGGGAGSRF